MREILFRGRKKGGPEWFEGDLSYLVHDKRECYIFPPDGYDSPDCYEVDPATVGQYTGLTDRNGTKIFEGDIVRHYNRPDDETAYKVALIFFDEKSTSFRKKNLDGTEYGVARKCVYQVIGNQWDNPELLEGQA